MDDPADDRTDSSPAGEPFVSTGLLPDPERVQELVDEAHRRFRGVDDGTPSNGYPALARVDPALFGICVVASTGRVFVAGDTAVEFPIMSVAKPFAFALVCEDIGHDEACDRIGVDATGLGFNSVEAIERFDAGRTNPMVNPGAIATTSLVPGRSADERWDAIVEGLSRFAGRELHVDTEVYASASASNYRNRAIGQLLQSFDSIYGDPAETVDLYTRMCSLGVSSHDLAVMAATLADGGVNPVTRERVVGPRACRDVLAVMTTAGMYETSGQWLYQVGLPGKSGIGGGIITVSPGKGGLGTFSPPLDAAGNSVRGQLVARFLSRQLGMDIFASTAVVDIAGSRSSS